MSTSGVEGKPRNWRDRAGTVWHEVWKAAITVFLGGIAALILTPWIQDTLTEPTCDDPRGLHLVARSDLSAQATGENPPEQGATYEAALAIDGDSSTAWVEGKPDSDPNKYGIGETLTITFKAVRSVQLLCVINGYASTQERYLHNDRVRQLHVVTDAGSTDSVLPEKPLEFYAGYQSVSLHKGGTAKIGLTIGTARAGQDPAQEADTAISEVEIWAAE